MKKVKSILFGLAAVSVVGLAACGGNTTPTTTTPAPTTTTTTQAAKVYEKDDTKHREVIDATAGTYGDWEAHTWGEWTVTKEATLTEKGSRTHTCTVCGQTVVEEIPKLLPTAGVTEEVTAIYAVVPETWESANVYYWDKDDDSGLEAAYKTLWPGEAMTLVSDDDNLFGFKLPVGVDHIIFNNGSEQTIDLDYAPSANLVTLTEKNGDGKYEAEYGTYTPKASDPELAGKTAKVFVPYDLYVKVERELATDESVHLYYWGGMTDAGDWPGKAIEPEQGTTNVYKLHVSAESTFIVNLGDGKLQTENISVKEFENAIIIKANSKQIPDGEDAQGNPKTKEVLDYVMGEYKNSEFTAFEPMKLYVKMEHELATSGKVYMHSWGGKYDHAEWPGLEMTKVEGTTNVYEIVLPYGSDGFIVNLGEGQLQTKNQTLLTSEHQNAFVVKATTIMDGENERLDVAPATYANGTFTEIEVTPLTAEGFYVRGSMTGASWDINADYALTPAQDKQSASLTVNFAAGDKFKVAQDQWANECGYVSTLPEQFKASGSDIEVVTAGRYTVTITITNNAPVLTITAVPAN